MLDFVVALQINMFLFNTIEVDIELILSLFPTLLIVDSVVLCIS